MDCWLLEATETGTAPLIIFLERFGAKKRNEYASKGVMSRLLKKTRQTLNMAPVVCHRTECIKREYYQKLKGYWRTGGDAAAAQNTNKTLNIWAH